LLQLAKSPPVDPDEELEEELEELEVVEVDPPQLAAVTETPLAFQEDPESVE
jgi:hypothetical protein